MFKKSLQEASSVLEGHAIKIQEVFFSMLNHWHFRVSNNYGCYCEGCSYACKRTNLSNNGPTCKLHSKVGHIRHYPFLSGTPSFPFRYGQDPDDFEYAMSEFLRMNGMYWGVACMDLMDRLSDMDR